MEIAINEWISQNPTIVVTGRTERAVAVGNYFVLTVIYDYY
jgi:hypothetical protein